MSKIGKIKVRGEVTHVEVMKMKHEVRKHWAIVLILGLIISFMAPHISVWASEKEKYHIKPQRKEVTVYIGQQQFVCVNGNYDGTATDAIWEKLRKIQDKVEWTTNKPKVVEFYDTILTDMDTGEQMIQTKDNVKNSSVAWLVGKSEGTAEVTATSKYLNTSVKILVHVKYAELTNNVEVFYANNTYDMVMKGNAVGKSFTSSNKKVATVDKKTGKVTTKRQGMTTISCKADDGNVYTYKMEVKKQGLSYNKLTSYYFTGMREGCYSEFPLVAAGIQVKSWKSSNKKVCQIESHGRVAILQMTGTGTCDIICTDKSGKKYVCKLTVKGGTTWSGLGGYTPTLSELKKHGYYQHINGIQDYGDAIVAIYDYANEINFNNGNPKWKKEEFDIRERLQDRYGNELGNCGGDLIQATLDNGKKLARIWVDCIYKE